MVLVIIMMDLEGLLTFRRLVKDNPNYDDLADSFRTFMTIDISLIIAALATFFSEMLLILRKDYQK